MKALAQTALGFLLGSLLVACPAWAANLAVVSGASYTPALAPASIASAFGPDLATAVGGNSTVTVQDSTGTTRSATLFYTSPLQVNFLIPSATATGLATVTVTSGDGTITIGSVTISSVAPGLFSAAATGQGVAAAIAVQGTATAPIFYCGPAGGCIATPVILNGTVLELYGTGIRGAPISGVTCTIGGVAAPVTYAGPAPGFLGLDQVNVTVPNSLANQGVMNIVLTANGQTTNAVTVNTNSADFFVSPSGNDAWSGTLPAANATATDGPFASAAKAQAALRSVVKSSPGRALTVMLRAGTYYLPLSSTGPGTLSFTSSDSGSASGPVTWSNFPGETPVINGGVPVGAGGLGRTWNNVSGSLWQVTLPAGTLPFEYLFYNDTRRLRARVQSPDGVGYYMSGSVCYATGTNQVVATSMCNLGSFLRIAAEIPPTGANANCPSATGTAAQGSKCLDRFGYNPSDPVVAWANLNPSGSVCGGTANNYPVGDIELSIFESWTMEMMRVGCVDTVNHIIYLTGTMQGGSSNGVADTFNNFGPVTGHRYMVENA
jgi:uncharacterized protein (TIGR03437 family)